MRTRQRLGGPNILDTQLRNTKRRYREAAEKKRDRTEESKGLSFKDYWMGKIRRARGLNEKPGEYGEVVLRASVTRTPDVPAPGTKKRRGEIYVEGRND